MSNYASLRQIRNWMLALWILLAVVILILNRPAAHISINDRLLRSELAHARDSSSALIIALGIAGCCVIFFIVFLLQQRINLDLRRYVAWAEQISNRRLNQPIAKLGSVPISHDLQWLPLDSLHEKMSKGIHLLEFRYQQLLEERARTADALRDMREGIMALNSNLELLLINQAGHELLGVTGPIRIGKPLFELVRQPQVLDLVHSVHESGKAAESVLKIGDKLGRLLRLRVSPLANEQTNERGDSGGVVVLVSDITRLTKLESMRRDFTANVSHELKTPLAAIQAYAETLLDGGAIDDPEMNRRFVEGISKQTNRLSALIHDLLQLAKLDAEPDQVTLSRVEMIAIVKDVIIAHTPIAAARDIQIRLMTNLDSAYILGTDDGLRAITNNLISNAIRYNREHGFVNVEISTNSSSVLLAVVDNGVGIAADEHDRVFERFYRVDKARSIDAGGTGLGLAIVKHLVLQMGGTISLQSKPGEGSRFEIKVPIYQSVPSKAV
jgi:two-component system phosphate regulon sensor histidine kinase PhoR